MKFLECCLAVLCLSKIALAQDETFKLNVDVDLVEVHVSVVDEKDRTVSGLPKDAFRLTENNVEQKLAVFKHEDQPVSLGLVLDNSRSIEPRKERLDAAALAFVRQGNPDDETFVVHFDFDARLSQDFTGDRQRLREVLSSTKPFGQTALYDAMFVAVDHIAKSKYDKKAILLVTDGLDNSSKHNLEELVEKLKQSRVAVYTIGLLSAAEGERGEQALLQIADASGGRAYFPANVEEVRVICERIARDLREQYTLGYLPTNANRDGSWRSVRVEVKPPLGYPPKLTANYRHGYYSFGKLLPEK